MFARISEMAKDMTARFDEINPDYTKCTKQQYISFRAQYDTDSEEHQLLGLVKDAHNHSPYHSNTPELFNFYTMLIEWLYDANEAPKDEASEMEIHLFILSIKVIYINKITPENLTLPDYIGWLSQQLDSTFTIDLLAYAVCIMRREGATANHVLTTNYIQYALHNTTEEGYINFRKEFIHALGIIANDEPLLKEVIGIIDPDSQSQQLPQPVSVIPFSIYWEGRASVDHCARKTQNYAP